MRNNRISSLSIVGKFAVALISVVVIQGILAFKFRIFGYFDLALICSVFYGFTLGRPVASILIGSALGLMQDSLSGAVVGTNGFSKTVIGYLAASAVSKFAVDQPVTRIFALFLFSLADGLLVTMLGLMVGVSPNTTYGGVAQGWMVTATLNTLLGLLMFGYHDRTRNATT
jgi:rod shape-determining protein MreD